MFIIRHSGKKDDNNVEVVTSFDVPGMGRYTVAAHAVQEHALLAAYIATSGRDLMHSKLKAIRQASYNEGWKDAKAKKKAKRSFFFSGWAL